MTNADYRRSAVDRILPVRARGDLQIVEMAFNGDAAYMVKDPVAGEAFQFSSEEHALLTALRQPVSLRSLQRELETAFAPRRATIEQIQQFVNRLYEQGLLVGEHPGRGAELRERGRRRVRRERWGNLVQLLSIRLGGFDAGPLTDRLYRAIGWAFTPWTAIVIGVLMVVALLTTLGHAATIDSGLSTIGELTRPGMLPVWLGSIVLVKVLHEFGHALACRHFGARPQEMGVLLLAGVPSLYCDVSDAWKLPSKWKRMGVSAGGMAVELAIAALAALIWRFVEPGAVRAVALSLIVVCSVGTLLINANPLLRYDGYYLLSDFLEVPNLAERARGLVGGAWRRWLLGETEPVDPLLSPGKRRALWIYAILAKAYMLLVLAGLLTLMLKLAKPYQLQNVVYTLAAVTLAGILLGPALTIAKMSMNPAVRARLRWGRLGASSILLLLTAAVVWSLPMTRRVAAPLVIAPANAHPLFVVAPGELEYAAAEGTTVVAGDVVARLRNPELELALAEAAGTVREQRTRLHQLRTLQSTLPAAARLLPTAAAELADAERQLVERQAMVNSLTVRAPYAGRIVAAPDRPAERTAESELRTWRGSPLASKNVGAWLEAGTPLCIVAAPGGGVAWAGVEQADVPAVEPGQPVRLVVEQQPWEVLTGRVTEVSQRARTNHRREAATAQRDATLGDERYHVVQIALDDQSLSLLPGIRGTAKISTYESSIGRLVMNTLRRTFQRVF